MSRKLKFLNRGIVCLNNELSMDNPNLIRYRDCNNQKRVFSIFSTNLSHKLSQVIENSSQSEIDSSKMSHMMSIRN